MFYIDNQTKAGDGNLLLIAGPCVAENKDLCMETAEFLTQLADKYNIDLVFKASFDKANRSSQNSFRGRGLEQGLNILKDVKEKFNLPVITDIHEIHQAEPAAEVVDIIQIPAFLCRQTDLLTKAGEQGKPVNIKKGQFMAPEDMKGAIDKVYSTNNNRIMLTERGTFFGYHNLVVDMRSLVTMREFGVPVVFDATHSVQRPGGKGSSTGGNREFVEPLARAATAVGIDALFVEVHPNPDQALSDGPNSLSFSLTEQIISKVSAINELTRENFKN